VFSANQRMGGSRRPCRGQEAPQRALNESVTVSPHAVNAYNAGMVALLLIAQLAGPPHWPAGARIAVWVDASRAPIGASALVERAMRSWTDAADGRLVLVRASTSGEAAIRVFFVQSDTTYGEAAPRVDPATGLIARADVAINASVPDNPIDARIVVYLTALHELGHALGLAHSDTFSAIMYRFRRADDGARYFGAYRSKLRSIDDVGSARATGLDPEDIGALRRLYR
jgi:matrixin